MLETEIDAIFTKQCDWVEHAANSGQYPGHIIHDVHAAIGIADRVVKSVAPHTNCAAYIEELIAMLDAAHNRYRQDYDDEDGYGSATFHEIKQALANLNSPAT